jgi:hypothetical protein
MSPEHSPQVLRMVVLFSFEGNPVTSFTTDRDTFPDIATHDRDRVFRLIYQGDITSMTDIDPSAGTVIQGAVYQEAEAWRISTRTIDKPRPVKRRRKSATILPFRRKEVVHA